MRILIIHQYFLEREDGGGSRFNAMADLWAEEGHHITVLAGMVHYYTGRKLQRYKRRFLFEDQYSNRVSVIRCHVSEAYNASFVGRLWAYFSFVMSSVCGGLFRTRSRPDVIVVTSPPLFVGITALVLSRLQRAPMVFEVRDLWPESAIDTGVLTNQVIIKIAYWFESFVYRRSRLVNVLTPAFRERLLEKGVPEDKLVLIPNAADFTVSDEVLSQFDREAFRQEHGWSEKVVVVYVGAHGVANHLIQLLEAAYVLRHRNDLHFVLIGTGMQKPWLMDRATELSLSNVEFIDPVPKREVFKYIAAADVGASILKRADTFKTVYSNKTFDYMACRRPVLMAIDGVSRQLVEAARCGVFVEPEDPSDFAKKVVSYAEMDPSERRKQGDAGYAFAKEHFDRGELASQYLRHLEEISR